MILLAPLDLSRNELRNAIIQNLATPPSSPLPGQTWYNSVINAEVYWNTIEWVPKDARLRIGIPLTNLSTDPLARANHTGTQTASTISDLSSVVHAYTLDSFGQPVATINMNGQKLTNLGAPAAGSTDSARQIDVENAVQSAAAGIDSKPSVRVVSTSNIGALFGLQTVDLVPLVAGDRILLTGQTLATQNGVYVVTGGTWTRAVDADQNNEITPGSFWFIEEGATYKASQWRCNNTGVVVLGSTSIVIIQFGAGNLYAAGNGLALTGSTFAAVAGNGIVVGASISIDTTVVAQKYSCNVGDGSSSTITVTHNLNTFDVLTQIRIASSNQLAMCDIQNATLNTVVLGFGAYVPPLNSLRVSIVG